MSERKLVKKFLAGMLPGRVLKLAYLSASPERNWNAVSESPGYHVPRHDIATLKEMLKNHGAMLASRRSVCDLGVGSPPMFFGKVAPTIAACPNLEVYQGIDINKTAAHASAQLARMTFPGIRTTYNEYDFFEQPITPAGPKPLFLLLGSTGMNLAWTGENDDPLGAPPIVEWLRQLFASQPDAYVLMTADTNMDKASLEAAYRGGHLGPAFIDALIDILGPSQDLRPENFDFLATWEPERREVEYAVVARRDLDLGTPSDPLPMPAGVPFVFGVSIKMPAAELAGYMREAGLRILATEQATGSHMTAYLLAAPNEAGKDLFIDG